LGEGDLRGGEEECEYEKAEAIGHGREYEVPNLKFQVISDLPAGCRQHIVTALGDARPVGSKCSVEEGGGGGEFAAFEVIEPAVECSGAVEAVDFAFQDARRFHAGGFAEDVEHVVDSAIGAHFAEERVERFFGGGKAASAGLGVGADALRLDEDIDVSRREAIRHGAHEQGIIAVAREKFGREMGPVAFSEID